MGKVMVGMRRNDMNQTSITTVFYTTPCGQCSVLFFGISAKQCTTMCAEMMLIVDAFNTETETLSGKKLDANDFSPCHDDLHETSRLCIKHLTLKKQGGKVMEMSFLLEPNQLEAQLLQPPSHDDWREAIEIHLARPRKQAI